MGYRSLKNTDKRWCIEVFFIYKKKKKKMKRNRVKKSSNTDVMGPTRMLLGDSGGVVNSLDFCPALPKSLGCF